MKNVIIYSTPQCSGCVKVKEFLKNKGVNFEVVDVSSNKEAAIEVVRKTKQRSVPVTKIDSNYIIGFRPEEIEKALVA
jgi:glutaredoxin-like YruB-family protein